MSTTPISPPPCKELLTIRLYDGFDVERVGRNPPWTTIEGETDDPHIIEYLERVREILAFHVSRHKAERQLPLPEHMGVLYDQEHRENQGGFHHTEEGITTWVETVTEGGGNGKTCLSDSFLRRQGYIVPPFTGTPCPKCFPSKETP